MPFRCREKGCAKRFSAKNGAVMEGSKLGFQVWMVAAFLLSTNLKSVSSMKLHRDLNINQRSAWFLTQRLRVALAEREGVFAAPLEVDETTMGGSRKNMSKAKRKDLTGRGIVGKTPVAGIKDRASWRIHAQVVSSTSAKNLHDCIRDNAGEAAAIYTDGQRAYIGLELTSSTRRSITAPENRYAGSCIPRVSSHFGQCSSELRWAPSTRSPPSILIAMSESSPEGTTSARKTPSTSWQMSLRAQSVSGFVTVSSSPITDCLLGQDREVLVPVLYSSRVGGFNGALGLSGLIKTLDTKDYPLHTDKFGSLT